MIPIISRTATTNRSETSASDETQPQQVPAARPHTENSQTGKGRWLQRPPIEVAVRRKYRKPDRHKRIIAAINANASVGVTELAAELHVSKQTIRRDLDELSNHGIVNRMYGGAAVRRVGLEPTLMERSKMATAERSVIADLAVELFSNGEVVMMGAGVTTYYLAKKLAARFDRLQVFTNNTSAGLVLSTNPGIRVVFAPGDFDPKEDCVCGAETLEFLEKFRADTAVFGASGLFEGGACEVHSGIAWVDRVMLRQARRHILLLDHSRFDRPHMELICPMGAIDVVVSDRMPDGELRDVLEANDVEIMCPKTTR
jgi:DeoR/GlpR family transcriptional regulator of sugar metabolism